MPDTAIGASLPRLEDARLLTGGGCYSDDFTLPGDDLKPETFKAFWSDGSFGIYIHPGIWHEGVFPVTPTGRFFDKQGKVHARVSCDLAREFGLLLGVPLPHAM